MKACELGMSVQVWLYALISCNCSPNNRLAYHPFLRVRIPTFKGEKKRVWSLGFHDFGTSKGLASSSASAHLLQKVEPMTAALNRADYNSAYFYLALPTYL